MARSILGAQVAQEADQTIVNLGRAQQCFRSKRFEVCDKYGKPEGARARDFVQLAEKNEHVYYFDIYELFVDTASEKTSSHFPSAQRFPGTVGVNLPGTKTVWEAWENIEQNDFSSHMSLVGSIYTWPCRRASEQGGLPWLLPERLHGRGSTAAPEALLRAPVTISP